MFCRRCGAEIPVDSVFCPSCGTNLILNEPEPADFRTDDETSPSRSREARPRATWMARAANRYQSAGSGVMRTGQTWMRSLRPRIGMTKILAAAGVLFGVVGFLVGLFGHTRGLDWLLFGLILILAAIYVALTHVAPDKKSEPKELTD